MAKAAKRRIVAARLAPSSPTASRPRDGTDHGRGGRLRTGTRSASSKTSPKNCASNSRNQRSVSWIRTGVARKQSWRSRAFAKSWRIEALRSSSPEAQVGNTRPPTPHCSFRRSVRRWGMRISWAQVGAGFGFLGVLLGAFGAHGLKTQLEASGRLDTWEKAVLYHLLHAAVLIAVTWKRPQAPRLACWALSIGILAFSGALYGLALTGIGGFGALAPLGGTAFLVGWGALFWESRSAS